MGSRVGDRGGKDSLSEAQKLKQKKLLAALLKLPDNRQCADCDGRSPPTWASVNIGVFVCLTCSGIHRSLGVHISQVRSATLDTWLPDQVKILSKIGNRRANEYYEKNRPASVRRPNPNDTIYLEKYIRQKYQHKEFADHNRSRPITSDEEQAEAAAAVPPQAPAPISAAPAQPKPQSQIARAPAPAASPPAPPLLDLLSLEDEPAAPAPTAAASASTGAWATFGDEAAPVPNHNAAISSAGVVPAPADVDFFGNPVANQTTTTFNATTTSNSNGNGTGGVSHADFGSFGDFASVSDAAQPAPTQNSDGFADFLGDPVVVESAKPGVSKSDILDLYSKPTGGGMGAMYGFNQHQQMQPQGMFGGMQQPQMQSSYMGQMQNGVYGMMGQAQGHNMMQQRQQHMNSYGQPQPQIGGHGNIHQQMQMPSHMDGRFMGHGPSSMQQPQHPNMMNHMYGASMGVNGMNGNGQPHVSMASHHQTGFQQHNGKADGFNLGF